MALNIKPLENKPIGIPCKSKDTNESVYIESQHQRYHEINTVVSEPDYNQQQYQELRNKMTKRLVSRKHKRINEVRKPICIQMNSSSRAIASAKANMHPNEQHQQNNSKDKENHIIVTHMMTTDVLSQPNDPLTHRTQKKKNKTKRSTSKYQKNNSGFTDSASEKG
ncbi:hypothetical protein M8C21_022766 [Ambrosia artemisiifolia]|uniref:Uncharacterized protein n=1 Tax=Ambrosia artemisiifolia TaxID=4212 RepID=A0AAD5DF47_AMBAR|nr:hypothetical protein M8C21_022766 [Ambrosia artemisiifolia]